MSMGREYCEKCGEEHGVAYECKPKADVCKLSALSELLDGYMVEAQKLIDKRNAFNDPRISQLDAIDAFRLLRKITKGEAV